MVTRGYIYDCLIFMNIFTQYNLHECMITSSIFRQNLRLRYASSFSATSLSLSFNAFATAEDPGSHCSEVSDDFCVDKERNKLFI